MQTIKLSLKDGVVVEHYQTRKGFNITKDPHGIYKYQLNIYVPSLDKHLIILACNNKKFLEQLLNTIDKTYTYKDIEEILNPNDLFNKKTVLDDLAELIAGKLSTLKGKYYWRGHSYE